MLTYFFGNSLCRGLDSQSEFLAGYEKEFDALANNDLETKSGGGGYFLMTSIRLAALRRYFPLSILPFGDVLADRRHCDCPQGSEKGEARQVGPGEPP